MSDERVNWLQVNGRAVLSDLWTCHADRSNPETHEMQSDDIELRRGFAAVLASLSGGPTPTLTSAELDLIRMWDGSWKGDPKDLHPVVIDRRRLLAEVDRCREKLARLEASFRHIDEVDWAYLHTVLIAAKRHNEDHETGIWLRVTRLLKEALDDGALAPLAPVDAGRAALNPPTPIQEGEDHG